MGGGGQGWVGAVLFSRILNQLLSLQNTSFQVSKTDLGAIHGTVYAILSYKVNTKNDPDIRTVANNSIYKPLKSLTNIEHRLYPYKRELQ